VLLLEDGAMAASLRIASGVACLRVLFVVFIALLGSTCGSLRTWVFSGAFLNGAF
jgi:hypothetical protein